MSVSRRRFLELGTLAIAATAVPSQIIAGEKPRRSAMGQDLPIEGQSEVVSLNYMTKDTFARLVNSTFMARDSAGKIVRLTLVSAEQVGTPKGNTSVVLRIPNPAKQIKRTDSFVLRFRTQSGKPLSQGTYSFNHVTLGNFALFIVPAGDSQPYCSAIFSRI